MAIVRLFKSRTLAAKACKAGRIRIDDRFLKPSYEISTNDILFVKKDGFEFTFAVKKLIEKKEFQQLLLDPATITSPLKRNFINTKTGLSPDWNIGKEDPGVPQRKKEGKSMSTKSPHQNYFLKIQFGKIGIDLPWK